MDFPDPVRRDGSAEILDRLSAVTLVAQQIVQIQHDTAVGCFGDLRRERTVRHLTRARRQIADRGLEGDVQAGCGATVAYLCGRLGDAIRTLRRRQEKPGGTGLIPFAHGNELIETEVVTDPGRSQGSDITGKRCLMRGRLFYAATERCTDTMQQLWLRPMAQQPRKR